MGALGGGSMEDTITKTSIGFFQVELESSKPHHYSVSKSIELDLVPVVYRVFSAVWSIPIDRINVTLSRSDEVVEWDYRVTAPDKEALVDLKVAWEAENYGTLAPPTTSELVVKLRNGVSVLLLTSERVFLIPPGRYSPPTKWSLRSLEKVASLVADLRDVEGWRPLDRLREAYGALRP